MIKSFRHKGLESSFQTGTKKGIQPSHANRLRVQLGALDNATVPEDMNVPGWRLHGLTGELARPLVSHREWQLAPDVPL